MLGKVAELLNSRVKVCKEKLTTVEKDLDVEATSKSLRCLLGSLQAAKEEMCLRAFKTYFNQLLRQEGRMLQRALEEEELEGIGAVIQRTGQLRNNTTTSMPASPIISGGGGLAPKGRNKSIVWTSELAASAAASEGALVVSAPAGAVRRASVSLSGGETTRAPSLIQKRLAQSRVLFKGRVKSVCCLKTLIPQKVTSLDDDEVTFEKAEALMRAQVGCGSQRIVPILEDDYQRLMENRKSMRSQQRQEDEQRRRKEMEALREEASKKAAAASPLQRRVPSPASSPGRGSNTFANLGGFGDANINVNAQSLSADYTLHLQCLSTLLIKTLFGKVTDSKVLFMWHNYIIPIVRAKFKFRDVVSRSDVKIRTALSRLQQLIGLCVTEATEADLQHDWEMSAASRQPNKKRGTIAVATNGQFSRSNSNEPNKSGSKPDRDFSDEEEDDDDEQDGASGAGPQPLDVSNEFGDEAENIAAALNASSDDEAGVGAGPSDRTRKIKKDKVLCSVNVGNVVGQKGFERPNTERTRAVLNRSCRATRACVVGTVSEMAPVVKMPRLPSMPPLWCFVGADESTSFALGCILESSHATQDYETALTDPEAYSHSLLHTTKGEVFLASERRAGLEPADGALQANSLPFLLPSGAGATKFLQSISDGAVPLTTQLTAYVDTAGRFGFKESHSPSTVSWVLSNTSDDGLRVASLARRIPLGIPLRTPTSLLELHSDIASVLRSIGDRHFNECESILLKLVLRGQMQRVLDIGVTHMLSLCLQLGLLYWVERRFADARRVITEAITAERQLLAGEERPVGDKISIEDDSGLERASTHQFDGRPPFTNNSFSVSSQPDPLNTSSQNKNPLNSSGTILQNSSFSSSLALNGSPKRGSFSLSKRSNLGSIMNAPTGSSGLARRASMVSNRVISSAEKDRQPSKVASRVAFGSVTQVTEISDGESPPESKRNSVSLPHLPLNIIRSPHRQSGSSSSYLRIMSPSHSTRHLFLSQDEQDKRIAEFTSSATLKVASLRIATMFGVLGLTEQGDGQQQSAANALETAAALIISQLEDLREGKRESLDKFFVRTWPNIAKESRPQGHNHDSALNTSSTFLTDSKRPFGLPSPRRAKGPFAALDASGSETELNTTRNLRSTQAHLSNTVANAVAFAIKEKKEQDERDSVRHAEAVADYAIHQRMELLHKIFLTLVSVYHPKVGDVLHAHVATAHGSPRRAKSPNSSTSPEDEGVTLEGYNLGIPSCLLACRDLRALPAYPKLANTAAPSMGHQARRELDAAICASAMENVAIVFATDAVGRSKVSVATPALLFIRYLHFNATYALMACGHVFAAITLYQRALHIATVLRDAAEASGEAGGGELAEPAEGSKALLRMSLVLIARLRESIDALTDVQQGLANA
eukprot:GILI01012581.1.p1 GENE.GILI01012581.1~~GILI01012581.1.p1  ORF type:complete len:1477 (+),score=271.30 GILI01012581.1:241-4431(+)